MYPDGSVPNALKLTNTANLYNGTYSGNGAGLTNLNITTDIAIGNIQGPNNTAPMVIWDDDIGLDFDGIEAYYAALGFMDKGLVNIIAAVSSTDNRSDVSGGPLYDVVNKYFKYPFIPIGTSPSAYQGGYIGITNNNGVLGWSGNPSPLYLANPLFSSTYTNSISYPSALTVYRKALGKVPTNSVTMIFAGPLYNLYNLYHSGPDQYSSLSGPDLIKRSCREIIIVSGNRDPVANGYKVSNFDIVPDPQLSSFVCSNDFGIPETFLWMNGAMGHFVQDSGAVINGMVGSSLLPQAVNACTTNWNPLYGDVPFPHFAPYAGWYLDEEWQVPWAIYGTNTWGGAAFTVTNGWQRFTPIPGYPASNYFVGDVNGHHRWILMTNTDNFYITNGANTFNLLPKNLGNNNGVSQSVSIAGQSILNVLNGQVVGVTNWSITGLTGMSFWFDSDSITNTVNNSTIVRWPESVFGGTLAATNAGATAPTYVTNQLNGHPVVNFNGSQFLQSLAKDYFKPASVFAVIKSAGVPSFQDFFAPAGTSGNNPGPSLRLTPGGLVEFFYPCGGSLAISPSPIANGPWYIIVATYANDGTSKLWLNGALVTNLVSILNPSFTPVPMLIGANKCAGTLQEQFSGQMADIGLSSFTLSDGDVASITTYFQNKYGLVTSGGVITSGVTTNINTPSTVQNAPYTINSVTNGLIQKSSTFGIINLGGINRNWFDSDTITNTVNGSTIVNWPESILGLYPATNGGPKAPTFIISGLNGHNVANFGTNQYLQSGVYTGQSQGTVIAVFNCTNNSPVYRTILGTQGSGGVGLRLNPSSQLELLFAGHATFGNSQTIFNTNTWYAVMATYSNLTGNFSIYVNGKQDTNGINSFGTFGNFTNIIGADNDQNLASPYNYFQGYIADTYTSDKYPQSAADVDETFKFLNFKYNIYPAPVVVTNTGQVNFGWNINGSATGLTNLWMAYSNDQQILTPEMFGAKGDGVADDTVPCNTCEAKAEALILKGFNVQSQYNPRLYYKMTGTLNLTNRFNIYSHGKTWGGVFGGAQLPTFVSSANPALTCNLTNIFPAGSVIEGITVASSNAFFNGAGKITAGQNGFVFVCTNSNFQTFNVNNCGAGGFDNGFAFTNINDTALYGLHVNNCTNGIVVGSWASGNSTTQQGCKISEYRANCYGTHLLIDGLYGSAGEWSLYDLDLGGAGNTNHHLTYFRGCRITAINCHLEGQGLINRSGFYPIYLDNTRFNMIGGDCDLGGQPTFFCTNNGSFRVTGGVLLASADLGDGNHYYAVFNNGGFASAGCAYDDWGNTAATLLCTNVSGGATLTIGNASQMTFTGIGGSLQPFLLGGDVDKTKYHEIFGFGNHFYFTSIGNEWDWLNAGGTQVASLQNSQLILGGAGTASVIATNTGPGLYFVTNNSAANGSLLILQAGSGNAYMRTNGTWKALAIGP
jgi:hypothetical protein